MPSDARAVDFERFGRDIWYSGLNSSKLDFAYTSHLDGSCWLNAFQRDSSSKGSEVLNARRFAEGGDAGIPMCMLRRCVRPWLSSAFPCSTTGFLSSRKAMQSTPSGRQSGTTTAWRRKRSPSLRGGAFALYRLHGLSAHAREDRYRGGRSPKRFSAERAETINDNTMLFAELCLHTTPAPLVPHSGFRRGSAPYGEDALRDEPLGLRHFAQRHVRPALRLSQRWEPLA